MVGRLCHSGYDNIVKQSRDVRSLVFMILLCGLYSIVLRLHVPLTGIHQLDGIFGVLLGLYTSSQPVANVLDIILYGRYLTVRSPSRRSLAAWWALNILSGLAGLVAIVTSLLRYSRLN
jgi:hypothetical protein